MTNEELDGLLAIEAAATSGPWTVAGGEQPYISAQGVNCVLESVKLSSDQYVANAAVLVEARNALRPLIEEVRRLRAENERLQKKTKRQAQTLSWQRECLEKKNVALDAMYWVWCSGGCEKGVRRWAGGKSEVTEEVVAAAESNTVRLRQKFGGQGLVSKSKAMGREAAIADVRAYLREEQARFDGASNHDAWALCGEIDDALERGDHEGAAKRGKAGT
ncbi:MAG: hypothetical protein HOW73_47690 [Polyangiaceae bacterium]|nr:hypothetical protein [Polyangiaceae bacterium]